MKSALYFIFTLIVLTSSESFAQKIYVFYLDRYCEINDFKDDIQINKSIYSGNYISIKIPGKDEMDATWNEMTLNFLDDKIIATVLLYVEAEPQAIEQLEYVSIKNNFFNAQKFNFDDEKYEEISGRFVYIIDCKSGKKLYGILMKEKNFDGEYDLYFYAKE